MEDYIKKEKEIRGYFNKKYKKCNSTLEKLLIDIDYKSAQNSLWNEFTKIFNKKYDTRNKD